MEQVNINLMVSGLNATLADDSRKETSVLPVMFRGMPTELAVKLLNGNGSAYPAAQLEGLTWRMVASNVWNPAATPLMESTDISVEGSTIRVAIEETDTKEIPPCLIRKSDGASLYATSDLATIVDREQDFKPDRYIYVVDKRQGMHFEQVFRVAKRAGIVKEDTPMIFLGFGTMNGKDGKPFKTREGGVMRLEKLIEEINEAVYKRIMENRTVSEDEARSTAAVVGLAALKYGDLSNQAAKDYVFDIERFTSFEGNTGPYILYTIVRIKSIIAKYRENGGQVSQDAVEKKILACTGSSEKALMLMLARYNEVLENSFAETAPHKICQYIYELANAFNSFYHDTKILAEEDEARKESYIGLISLTRRVLEACIGLLGIEAPERM